MSDVAEEAMDSSAVSEEDVDESAPCKSSSKISGNPQGSAGSGQPVPDRTLSL